MVIISTTVDEADLLAAANGGAPAPGPPAATTDDPAAALSLFDVVHGTAAAAADTTMAWWWSSEPPNHHAAASTTATSSGAYASSSSSFPPPPPLQSHGDNLGCYGAGYIMDTLFPQPVHMHQMMQPPSMAELSYLYYHHPQPQPCFAAAPFALEPATTNTVRPELQLLPATMTQQPAVSASPWSSYTQTPGTTTTAPALALADTQQAAQEDNDDTSRPTPPRRRGRPSKSKRAPTVSVSEPPVSILKTLSAATGSSAAMSSCAATGWTTMSSSAAGQVVSPPPPRYGYADTSAAGVRFQPTDEQLIEYLRMKYAGQELPVDYLKEFDVYQAHPMAIRGACGESHNGCWYAFSPRDRKYRNGQRPARSVVFAEGGRKEQVGFWKSNSKLGAVREGGGKHGAVIGRMTSLTFHLGRQPRGTKTGWKMKEYTIPENQHQPDGSAMLLNNWVVCKLFYKELRSSRCTNTKSEKDRNTTSVGQKRPRRGTRKNKNDKNAITVAVGQEDGPGEAAGESVQQGGEEDMPQMQVQVPAAHHQASDYSEQDLCVEDYLVCDVAFAQQTDVQTVAFDTPANVNQPPAPVNMNISSF